MTFACQKHFNLVFHEGKLVKFKRVLYLQLICGLVSESVPVLDSLSPTVGQVLRQLVGESEQEMIL